MRANIMLAPHLGQRGRTIARVDACVRWLLGICALLYCRREHYRTLSHRLAGDLRHICSVGQIASDLSPTQKYFAPLFPAPAATQGPAFLLHCGEQFCTDAVGQQAHVEQRLGACPPALLPVKSILLVFGPSRGWLSVWGSFSCCETRRYAGVDSRLRMAVWRNDPQDAMAASRRRGNRHRVGWSSMSAAQTAWNNMPIGVLT
jgi:hypothetical protein